MAASALMDAPKRSFHPARTFSAAAAPILALRTKAEARAVSAHARTPSASAAPAKTAFSLITPPQLKRDKTSLMRLLDNHRVHFCVAPFFLLSASVNFLALEVDGRTLESVLVVHWKSLKSLFAIN